MSKADDLEIVNTVTLAKLLKVSKAAISQAIASKRLDRSVKKVGNSYRIHLVDAVYEWRDNAEQSKIRSEKNLDTISKKSSAIDNTEVPAFQVSRDMKAYYSALNERIEFEKNTGNLSDRKDTEEQVFTIFRALSSQLRQISFSVDRDQQKNVQSKLERALDGFIRSNLQEVDSGDS